MARADADVGRRDDRLTSDERAELALLRREKRRLETENEIAEGCGVARADAEAVASPDPSRAEIDEPPSLPAGDLFDVQAQS